jgi:hypothetical protein
MLCVVDAALEGVYVTEQLLESLVADDSVQLAAGLKPPAPVWPNATDPPGGDFVPAESVSVTVAVHVVSSATTIDAGLQLTSVDVSRRLTVTPEPTASPLSEWTSPDCV